VVRRARVRPALERGVSLLLLSRPRVVASVASPPPEPPSGAIAAVYRTWGSPVDSTARGTLPLAPNHGYGLNDIALFRNDVEVPIYREFLRGRHNNGTGGDGGARALYYECDTTGWTDGDVMEWRLGTPKATTDLSGAGRGSMAMLRTHYDNPRVVLPTSATYLCSTWSVFHPLVPDAQKHPNEQAWAVTFRNTHITNYGVNWWAAPSGFSIYGDAVNWYDIGWTAFAWWCETGNPDRWWEANRWTNYWFLPSTPPANDTTTAAGIHLNPENLPGQITSNLSEWRSMYIRESATAYLCIGYGQFWRNVNVRTMVGSMGRQAWFDAGVNIIGTGGGRANMAWNCLPGIYGALIDATWMMPTGDWAGGNVRRQPTFATDLPRILTAFDDATITAGGGGAYRAGYKGYRDGTLAMTEVGNQPGSFGDWEQFQGAIPTKTLIDYYLNIHADPRIPSWVRTNAETICFNLFTDPATNRVGAEYMATRTPAARKGAIEAPWDDGPYYEYTAAGDATGWSLTQITLPASFNRNPADIVGRFIGVWWQAPGTNYNYGREITAYDNTTKVVTLASALPVDPTGAPWLQYKLFTTTLSESISTNLDIRNALDHMRILQFCAALYPTDVVNGRTFAQWCDEMGTQLAGFVATDRWATSGSTLGRWMETAGCYFRAVGVPSGPSAIREPIVHTSA
jgi:hypothetical protein